MYSVFVCMVYVHVQVHECVRCICVQCTCMCTCVSVYPSCVYALCSQHGQSVRVLARPKFEKKIDKINNGTCAHLWVTKL